MADVNGFTPTEAKMLRLLGDGHPHRVAELKTCLKDEEPAGNSVQVHIHYLRKKLRVKGEDVIETVNDGSLTMYRLVRLTASHARRSP